MSEWVELPEGVKHHRTTAIAQSWEAWDALSEQAGWKYRPPTRSRSYAFKEAMVRGHRTTVFAPLQPRKSPANDARPLGVEPAGAHGPTDDHGDSTG